MTQLRREVRIPDPGPRQDLRNTLPLPLPLRQRQEPLGRAPSQQCQVLLTARRDQLLVAVAAESVVLVVVLGKWIGFLIASAAGRFCGVLIPVLWKRCWRICLRRLGTPQVPPRARPCWEPSKNLRGAACSSEQPLKGRKVVFQGEQRAVNRMPGNDDVLTYSEAGGRESRRWKGE